MTTLRALTQPTQSLTQSLTQPALTPALTPETPFFPFTPDFPTWKGDLAYTSGDYQLLNVATSTQGDSTIPPMDPLKDKAKPIVFLSLKVVKELQYITDRAATKTGECACMLLSKPLSQKDERHILVYDYILAKQDASGAHVALDLEDVNRYTSHLKTTFPEQWQDTAMAENLQHWHSHANMAVFNSGTDVHQQESPTELGFQSRHRFFLIFNTQKQVRCTMVMYAPIFQRVENVLVGLYTGDGVPNYPGLTRERQKHIDTVMDALIKAPPPKVYKHPEADWDLFRTSGWAKDRQWYSDQEGPEGPNVPRAKAPAFEDGKPFRQSMWAAEKTKFTEKTRPNPINITERIMAELSEMLDERVALEDSAFEIGGAVLDSQDNLQESMDAFVENYQFELGNLEEAGCDVDCFVELIATPLAGIKFIEQSTPPQELFDDFMETVTVNLTSMLLEINDAQDEGLFINAEAYADINQIPLIDILYASKVDGAYEMLIEEGI